MRLSIKNGSSGHLCSLQYDQGLRRFSSELLDAVEHTKIQQNIIPHERDIHINIFLVSPQKHNIIGLDKSGIRYIFFLFLHKNICCGYSLEASQRGTSNE